MKKRNTFQKDLVFRTVETLEGHPTAEEIYEAAKEQYPNISLTTVYRNLNLLVSEGLIGKLPAGAGSSADRYDFQREPHCHIECLSCSRFSNTADGEAQQLSEAISDRTGYLIKSRSLVFQGICPQCQMKESDQ